MSLRMTAATQPVRCYKQSQCELNKRSDAIPYNLPVITMDQDRVISSVKYHFHNGVHDGLRYLSFLGTLHVDDNMLDSIRLEESLVAFWIVFLNKGAMAVVSALSERRG